MVKVKGYFTGYQQLLHRSLTVISQVIDETKVKAETPEAMLLTAASLAASHLRDEGLAQICELFVLLGLHIYIHTAVTFTVLCH